MILQSFPFTVPSMEMGTSNVRDCRVDAKLKIYFQKSVNVRLNTGLDGCTEQDKNETMQAVQTCIKTKLNAWTASHNLPITEISFSNAVASLIQPNDQDQPILSMLVCTEHERLMNRVQSSNIWVKNCIPVRHATHIPSAKFQNLN